MKKLGCLNKFFFFKDQRDKIQKKTFTKWVNKHLGSVSSRSKI